jgi:integrase
MKVKKVKVTVANLQSRDARSKLRARSKPYYINIARSLQLGYRRNAHHGVWIVRDARGGGDWTRRIATADDHAKSNHETVLDFYEAQTRAHEIAGAGKDGEPVKLNAPATVGTAIDAYIADLESRDRSTANAKTAKRHLQADPLFNRSVALLQRQELENFRAKLRKRGLKVASVNRITGILKAALNLAASNDRKRITNTWEWMDGLAWLEGGDVARKVFLTDDDVERIVTAAYQDSLEFGLYVSLAAHTGARPSQLARATVDDLQVMGNKSRVIVPGDFKVGGRKRTHKRQRASQPLEIPHALAIRLQQAAKGRGPGAPLLLAPCGASWREAKKMGMQHFKRVAEKLDLRDETGKLVTMYALRHSHIARDLKLRKPSITVALHHFTGVAKLESNYARFLGWHPDADGSRPPRECFEPALKVVA